MSAAFTSSQVASAGHPREQVRGRWSRWYVRLPAKWAIFLIVTFFVQFPNPAQFARHLAHLRDMQAMIDPSAGEFDAWLAELNPRFLPHSSTPAPSTAPRAGLRPTARQVQRAVEDLVLQKVRYEWDWNLWGSADYMPTVAEIFQKARETDGVVREDCDGRAVIAASLMKRLGYSPSLVTDLRHVWVETPEGSWMGPGGAKTIQSTPAGNRLQPETAAWNIPISLSYGIAVFPLGRELIILLTAWLLMLRRSTPWKGAAAGLVLLVQGLLFMRLGYLSPETVSPQIKSWPSYVGVLHVVAGLATLWVSGRRPLREGAAASGEPGGDVIRVT